MHGPHRDKKRVSNPLELSLSCWKQDMGAGDWTQVLCKSHKVLTTEPLSQTLGPILCYMIAVWLPRIVVVVLICKLFSLSELYNEEHSSTA